MLLLTMLLAGTPVLAEGFAEDPMNTSASPDGLVDEGEPAPEEAEPAPEEEPESEAEEMAAQGFTEELPEEKAPLRASDGLSAIQATPLLGFELAGGRSPVQSNAWGLTFRTVLTHSSVQLGLGPHSNQPGYLWGPGVSASGYWKPEAAGLSASLGVAKSYIAVDQSVSPAIRYLRWAPFFTVGYRTYVIDKGAFQLPLTGSVGLTKPPGRDLIERSNLLFELTLGAQLNVQGL